MFRKKGQLGKKEFLDLLQDSNNASKLEEYLKTFPADAFRNVNSQSPLQVTISNKNEEAIKILMAIPGIERSFDKKDKQKKTFLYNLIDKKSPTLFKLVLDAAYNVNPDFDVYQKSPFKDVCILTYTLKTNNDYALPLMNELLAKVTSLSKSNLLFMNLCKEIIKTSFELKEKVYNETNQKTEEDKRRNKELLDEIFTKLAKLGELDGRASLRQGGTLAHYCCTYNEHLILRSIVKLIDEEGHPDFLDGENSQGFTPFHILIQSVKNFRDFETPTKMTEALIECEADIEDPGKAGFSPLIYDLMFCEHQKHKVEIARILIQSGADINRTSDGDKESLTPKQFIETKGDNDLKKLLGIEVVEEEQKAEEKEETPVEEEKVEEKDEPNEEPIEVKGEELIEDEEESKEEN